MKFRIFRTSHYTMQRNEQPCEEAYIDGHFDSGEAIWCININTLEELISLAREYKRPFIIDENTIEIYDDYRE